MARGRKAKEVKTTFQLLEDNSQRICETEELLKALKVERKSLEAQKIEEESRELLAAIAAKGMTVQDAIDAINNK